MTQNTQVISEDSIKKATKLIRQLTIVVIAIVAVVAIILPKAADERGKSAKRAGPVASFPQAVCADEEVVEYLRSNTEPMADKSVRSGCQKKFILHLTPNLPEWRYTSRTDKNGLLFRFFGDDNTYQAAAGDETYFGRRGVLDESCPDYQGTCKVVHLKVATVSGNGTITFSRAPRTEQKSW